MKLYHYILLKGEFDPFLATTRQYIGYLLLKQVVLKFCTVIHNSKGKQIFEW